MAYFGSCKPARLCFASHSTIAKKLGIHVKSVQRAVKYLQAEGLIRRLSVGSGRTPATYLIVGQSPVSVYTESTQGGLKVHLIEERSKEGKAGQDHKPFFGVDEAQSKGIPAPTATTEEPMIQSLDLPSLEPEPEPEPEQSKASAPVAFNNPKQIALLFKLQRKLGYKADDNQALVFDGLEHTDKKRIIDKLEAEEQKAAANGEVEAPPPKPLEPRSGDAEVRPTRAKKPTEENCRHVWYGPDFDNIFVCGICGAEKRGDDDRR